MRSRGIAAIVDGDEWPGAALAVIVQGAATNSLPVPLSPAIITVRSVCYEPGEQAVDFLHGGRAAHQRNIVLVLPAMAAGVRLLRLGQGAARRWRSAPSGRKGIGRYSYAPRLGGADGGHEGGFCALMTMTGRSGRAFLMRGRRSNAFSFGHHHVGDDEIAIPLADPSPQGGRVCRRSAPRSPPGRAPG